MSAYQQIKQGIEDLQKENARLRNACQAALNALNGTRSPDTRIMLIDALTNNRRESIIADNPNTPVGDLPRNAAMAALIAHHLDG